jgi:DNA end-binding protein Ku
MAPRPYWKGYLKLSLVTCPVQMEPARTSAGSLTFHTLNRKTGNRVESRYVDADTEKPVDDEDQVRGYPIDDDRYVMLEDEELEAVALESTRTIDIDRFVPAADIGWIWLDRPHFLKPGDKVGEEAFAVIREAMKATATVALSRLVLYRREHAIALMPREKGILLWTLRYRDELRTPETEPAKADPKLTRLVTRLIDERTTDWSDDLVDDPVQDKLEKIIARKKKGAGRPGKTQKDEAPAPTEGNVVSIMDALKRSIAAGRKAR